MIKIKMINSEFTLNGEEWSGEDQGLVKVLNSETAMRPFRYEPSPEHAIADYIVANNKEFGAEIIFDSEADKPPKPPSKYRIKY